jgi:hypothetical protein
MKIFWSWQDDLPGKANRHFIKAALEVAVATLAGEYEWRTLIVQLSTTIPRVWQAPPRFPAYP